MGIVAGVCQEIGLAAYLDALAGPSHQQVSVGTTTVAMLLNGLGFNNRRLYLISQFFATKPVEYLLGPEITAEQLHDDCLGRTLDWLYAHDPTMLFAGIARQVRQRFGLAATLLLLEGAQKLVVSEMLVMRVWHLRWLPTATYRPTCASQLGMRWDDRLKGRFKQDQHNKVDNVVEPKHQETTLSSGWFLVYRTLGVSAGKLASL